MSIASETAINRYTGNGAVDTYAYAFFILDETHLEVTVRNTSDVETTLTITTDYTVTGVEESGGGNVVLVNSAQAWLDGDGDLKSGYIIAVKRVMPLIQDTDIRNNGSYYPSIHEDALDYLTYCVQQLNETLKRAARNPVTLAESVFDPTLPGSMPDNPLATLIINAAGDGLDLGPTSTALLAAETNAAASAAAALVSENAAAASEAAALVSELAAAVSAAAAAVSAAQTVATVWGTIGSPKTIVDATGIVGATFISTLLPYQIIFANGDSVGLSAISANPQVEAHTVVGARLLVRGVSTTSYFSLDNGNGLKLNGIWHSAADDGNGGLVANNLRLFWNGSLWEEEGRLF